MEFFFLEPSGPQGAFNDLRDMFGGSIDLSVVEASRGKLQNLEGVLGFRFVGFRILGFGFRV